MRRLSHGDGWGFTPVLKNTPLFPKTYVSRLSLEPTGCKETLSLAGIDVVIGRKAIVIRYHSFGIIRRLESIQLSKFIGVAVHYTPAPIHWRKAGMSRLAPFATIEGGRVLLPNKLRHYIFSRFFSDSSAVKLDKRERPFFKKLTVFVPNKLKAFLHTKLRAPFQEKLRALLHQKLKAPFQEKLRALFTPDVPYERQEEGVVSLYLLHEDRSKDLLLYYADHEDEIHALWKFWSDRLHLPRLLVGPDGFIDEPFTRQDTVEIRQAQQRGPFYHLKGRGPAFARVRDMGRKLDGCRGASRCLGREIIARD